MADVKRPIAYYIGGETCIFHCPVVKKGFSMRRTAVPALAISVACITASNTCPTMVGGINKKIYADWQCKRLYQ